jgi:menaquinone-dependent protoporphyrinogen oxidase
MTRVLVLYASTHGHTAKIAARIAEAIGPAAELRSVDDAAQLAPWEYDAVVVGASIHAGRHQREVLDWVRARSGTLNSMPSAFFSVCLTAADDTEEARATSQRYIDELLEATAWSPRLARTFAGALQYREYDLFTRLLIKLMMKRGGHPTDTSRDHDFTDWEAVDAFGLTCAELVGAPVP